MHRLEQQLGNRAQFFHLDWDDGNAQAVGKSFGIRGRSTYVLLDGEGSMMWQWSGPLNEETALVQLDEVLTSLGY